MAVDKLVDSAQLETDLTSIANAIRNKGGTSNLLSFPTGFVSAINDIQTGSGSEDSDEVLVEKDVNFIDYDGTLLYSYTAAEANALIGLPANPSHTGLVAQGWNWTLSEIKSRLASSIGPFFVGQMYTTASGNTEIDIEIDEATVNVTLYLKLTYSNPNQNGIKIYWGDGPESYYLITGAGNMSSTSRYGHTYTNTGKYTVSVELSNGAELRLAAWGTSYTYDFCGLYWSTGNDWYGDRNKAPTYSSIVKAVRVGNYCDLYYRAFKYCTSLEYVTLPSTLTRNHTHIQGSTFYGCYSLKSLTIPRGITDIDDSAFCNAMSLKNISIPNTVEHVTYNIFMGCRSLENGFVVSSGVPYNYFNENLSLKKVSILNTITEIGNGAFTNCHALSSIIIPNSVTTIGNSAFNSCEVLKNITIPNNLRLIGMNAFKYCGALSSIELPDTLTDIDDSVFCFCYSLTNITMPSDLTRIGNNTFLECSSLFTITLPETLTEIGSRAFESCISLIEIRIPSLVTKLEANTFYQCSSLKKAELPSGLTSIGNKCFYQDRNLLQMTIPATVTNIGSEAFYYCTGCTEYHLLPTTPPTLASTNAFQNTTATFYVPQGCLEAYQTANNWSTYASKMQEEPST